MPSGYVRNISRQQAQNERTFNQQFFQGGQNSDTPPVKIGDADLALLENAISFREYVEGRYGRRLASDEYIPGSGTEHDYKQHSVTGRWLFHRGDKLWLSADRRLANWTEVTSIGVDGSLEEEGVFGDGTVDLSGDVASYLSAMVLSEVAPGTDVYIQFEKDIGLYMVRIYSDPGETNLIAFGSISDATSLPAAIALAEQGGSGVSGTVSADADPGTVRDGTGAVAEYGLPIDLRGLTLENTDQYKLWWKVEVDGSDATLTLYKDEVMAEAVASTASFIMSAGRKEVAPENDSGITGTIRWGTYTPATGTYVGVPVTFTFDPINLDGGSNIDSFSESGFTLFLKSPVPQNIYIEQSIGKYWFLSTTYGYGDSPIGTYDPGVYKYRYLYTDSRIVDPLTKAPNYSGNRVDSLLAFEGPSNAIGIFELDYATLSASNPIDSFNTLNVLLVNPSGIPVNLNAAAYITHISIYRTLDVGVNGIGPDSAANNSEIYIWIADVPIYSTEYTDTTTDDVLRNRFAGGSTQGENFALRSRFFREMDRGIGAIGPDFLFTATPRGARVTYCDVSKNPRFIGYHFPSYQRQLLQDPVSEIVRTKELFVTLCPASNYTSVTSIATDDGTPGITFIPVIQNFERSSQTIGLKYGQRTFPVDDSSFVSLCSDGTIRVFSATAWGQPLEGKKVHKLTERAQVGAVLGFINGALYFWYTEDPDATVTDKCLRLGTTDQSGSGWSVVTGVNWAYPAVGSGMSAIWEDEAAALRLVVVDDAAAAFFSIEDLPPERIYEDEIPGYAPVLRGAGAEYLSNIDLPGWEGSTLYGIIRSMGGGLYAVEFYASASDRTNNINIVATTVQISEPADGVEITGTMPGFIDVLSLTPSEFTVVDGIKVASVAPIVSPVRPRDLIGTQQNFTCFHQESHVFMRFPYGMPVPVVACKWYADGVLVNETSSVPSDGDIQSFVQVSGRTIQIELIPQSSGWQITGINTKYQTQDKRSTSGPWNWVEAALQRELAVGMISWVNGTTGLINRTSPTQARYVGATPALIMDPRGRAWAQEFLTPVTYALPVGITTYSIMFWVKGATLGALAAPVAMLDADGQLLAYLTFTDAVTADAGSFQYTISPSVDEDSGWQYFCLTRDDSYFALYQNGLLIRKDLLTPGSLLGVTSLRLGCEDGTQKMFDPRCYSTTLSAEAVQYYFTHPGQVP